jgi:hypothetical protein
VLADGEGGVRVLARRLGQQPIEHRGKSVAEVAIVVYEEALLAA